MELLAMEQLKKPAAATACWQLDPHDDGGRAWNLDRAKKAVRAAAKAPAAATQPALADLQTAVDAARQLLGQNGAENNLAAHDRLSSESAAAYAHMDQDAGAMLSQIDAAVVRLQAMSQAGQVTPAAYSQMIGQLDSLTHTAQAQMQSYAQAAANAEHAGGAAAASIQPVVPPSNPLPATGTAAAVPSIPPKIAAAAAPASPPPATTPGLGSGSSVTPTGQAWDGYDPYSGYDANVTFSRTATAPSSFARAVAGMQPAYRDNFTKQTKLDSSRWTVGNDSFHGGNGELESYRPSQVSLAPGRGVVLTARQIGTGSFDSGKIYATGANMGIAAGAVQFTATLPKGGGLWPAFWLLPVGHNSAAGNDPQWPVNGELDAAEIEGGNTTTVHGSAHVGTVPNQDNALGGIFNGGKADYADGKPHTFGIAWDRAGIRWFVDGQQYKTINYAELPTSQQALLRQAFASGTKFAPIINLAVGGKFDGRYTDASGAAIAAAKTRFPASLTLSDVQAWTV